MRNTAMALMVATLLLGAAPSLAQAPPPASTTSVSQILEKMSANTSGLASYSVPLHVEAHVAKGILSAPIRMDGTRYFKAPDSSALVLHGVPAVAKQFANLYASLGSPQTWGETYNITVEPAEQADAPNVLTLRGTYKRPSNVDHVLLDVDSRTFEPREARWFYRNGATIVVNVTEGVIDGKYHLPLRETVTVAFPDYHGSAAVTFGAYATNVSIPSTVFSNR